MAYKTHFEICVQSPNESDTQGYYVTACGREHFEKSTTDWKAVTCKECLKVHRANLMEDLIVAARRVADEGLPEHSWCRCLEDVLEAIGEEV